MNTEEHGEQMQSERGAVLLGVLMIVLILTLLGMVSMNLAVQEVLQISAGKDEARLDIWPKRVPMWSFSGFTIPTPRRSGPALSCQNDMIYQTAAHRFLTEWGIRNFQDPAPLHTFCTTRLVLERITF